MSRMMWGKVDHERKEFGDAEAIGQEHVSPAHAIALQTQWVS